MMVAVVPAVELIPTMAAPVLGGGGEFEGPRKILPIDWSKGGAHERVRVEPGNELVDAIQLKGRYAFFRGERKVFLDLRLREERLSDKDEDGIAATTLPILNLLKAVASYLCAAVPVGLKGISGKGILNFGSATW